MVKSSNLEPLDMTRKCPICQEVFEEVQDLEEHVKNACCNLGQKRKPVFKAANKYLTHSKKRRRVMSLSSSESSVFALSSPMPVLEPQNTGRRQSLRSYSLVSRGSSTPRPTSNIYQEVNTSRRTRRLTSTASNAAPSQDQVTMSAPGPSRTRKTSAKTTSIHAQGLQTPSQPSTSSAVPLNLRKFTSLLAQSIGPQNTDSTTSGPSTSAVALNAPPRDMDSENATQDQAETSTSDVSYDPPTLAFEPKYTNKKQDRFTILDHPYTFLNSNRKNKDGNYNIYCEDCTKAKNKNGVQRGKQPNSFVALWYDPVDGLLYGNPKCLEDKYHACKGQLREKQKIERKRRAASDDNPRPKKITCGIYYVERVVNKRDGREGQPEYLVKWLGYPEEDNTWEGRDCFYDTRPIDEFEASRSAQRLPQVDLRPASPQPGPSRVLEQAQAQETPLFLNLTSQKRRRGRLPRPSNDAVLSESIPASMPKVQTAKKRGRRPRNLTRGPEVAQDMVDVEQTPTRNEEVELEARTIARLVRTEDGNWEPEMAPNMSMSNLPPTPILNNLRVAANNMFDADQAREIPFEDVENFIPDDPISAPTTPTMPAQPRKLLNLIQQQETELRNTSKKSNTIHQAKTPAPTKERQMSENHIPGQTTEDTQNPEQEAPTSSTSQALNLVRLQIIERTPNPDEILQEISMSQNRPVGDLLRERQEHLANIYQENEPAIPSTSVKGMKGDTSNETSRCIKWIIQDKSFMIYGYDYEWEIFKRKEQMGKASAVCKACKMLKDDTKYNLSDVKVGMVHYRPNQGVVRTKGTFKNPAGIPHICEIYKEITKEWKKEAEEEERKKKEAFERQLHARGKTEIAIDYIPFSAGRSLRPITFQPASTSTPYASRQPRHDASSSVDPTPDSATAASHEDQNDSSMDTLIDPNSLLQLENAIDIDAYLSPKTNRHLKAQTDTIRQSVTSRQTHQEDLTSSGARVPPSKVLKSSRRLTAAAEYEAQASASSGSASFEATETFIEGSSNATPVMAPKGNLKTPTITETQAPASGKRIIPKRGVKQPVTSFDEGDMSIHGPSKIVIVKEGRFTKTIKVDDGPNKKIYPHCDHAAPRIEPILEQPHDNDPVVLQAVQKIEQNLVQIRPNFGQAERHLFLVDGLLCGMNDQLFENCDVIRTEFPFIHKFMGRTPVEAQFSHLLKNHRIPIIFYALGYDMIRMIGGKTNIKGNENATMVQYLARLMHRDSKCPEKRIVYVTIPEIGCLANDIKRFNVGMVRSIQKLNNDKTIKGQVQIEILDFANIVKTAQSNGLLKGDSLDERLRELIHEMASKYKVKLRNNS